MPVTRLGHIKLDLEFTCSYNCFFLSCLSRHRVFPNGTLLVRQVQREDAGIYKCAGLSSGGPQQKFAAELSIACECSRERVYCELYKNNVQMTVVFYRKSPSEYRKETGNLLKSKS